MDEGQIARRPRRLRVVSGSILVVVPLTVTATTWSALVANRPSYPLALVVSLLLGVWLMVSGLRATTSPKPGSTRTILRVLGTAAAVGLAVTLLWLRPMLATPAAIEALHSDDKVTVTDTWWETTYEPTTPPSAALVFYPGARVDPRAYARLARAVAEHGYRVIVPKCPLDLALLCTSAADNYVTEDIPWAVGGHSLGGVEASKYAAASNTVDGLVLWGAWPLTDLSNRGELLVASISGSEDGLSTPQKIDAHRDLLPPTTTFTEIQGSIHSYFGDYGQQAGDGQATIGREAAQEQIVAATVDLLDQISRPTTAK